MKVSPHGGTVEGCDLFEMFRAIRDVGDGVCPRKALGCRARVASGGERQNPERDTLAKPPSKCD